MTLRESEVAVTVRDIGSLDTGGDAFVGSLARDQPAGAGCGRFKKACAQGSPSRNALLAALPATDYQRLRTLLEPVLLRRGLPLYRAGEPAKYLYFPIAGIVSRCYLMRDGATMGGIITGDEGVIGVASFLGDDTLHGEAVALSDGHAFRLGCHLVNRELERHHDLARLLLRYTQVLIAQTAQVAACARHHSLEQQLCRLILSSVDRLHANELAMTHELIARLLGVRREGVTRAALTIRDAGLIDYRRGRLVVLDRRALQARACECYGQIKLVLERLGHSMLPT